MFGFFGNTFETATKRIISDNFIDGEGRPYIISRLASPIFKEILNTTKHLNGNAYDAAITFMLVQINSLSSIGSDELSTRWAETIIAKCEYLRPMARNRSTIDYMMQEVEARFSRPASGSNRYSSFEEWYAEFKKACGIYDAGLTPDKEGGSLIDFLEDGPLRRAYKDNKDPHEIAKLFVNQFDINKLEIR